MTQPSEPLTNAEIEKLATMISNKIIEKRDKPTDYLDTLTEWNLETLAEIQKFIRKDIDKNKKNKDYGNIEKYKDYKLDMDLLMTQVIRVIKDLKKEKRYELEINPLLKLLPFASKKTRRMLSRSGRNWLSLLLTGTGLLLIWRGIWEGSGYLLSTQGSFIVGLAFLITTAWLERRKVFSLFGQQE